MASKNRQILVLLNLAAKFLSSGNLTSTDLVCRRILEIEPHNSEALNIIGIVAAKLGLQSQAIEYFQSSLASSQPSAFAAKNIEMVRNKPSLPSGETLDGPKYLVIKAWGRGFWSDVSHVLGCLLLAEITNRIPVTHWGSNSLFGNGSSSDAFRFYFEQVSDVTLDQITQITDPKYFPPKWNRRNLIVENLQKWAGPFSRVGAIFFLQRHETVAVSDFYLGVIDVIPWIPSEHAMCQKSITEIYRYLIKKYIQPRKPILAECDEFFNKRLRGAPIVAIHLRGSDKIFEDFSLEASNQACLSVLATFDPSWRIFLLTDDERLLSQVSSIYGDRVVATNCQRTATNTGVHSPSSAVDRSRIGMEIMIDTYLALRADRFIGNGQSNVSAMIALLKEWRPADCTLVRPSNLFDRHVATENGIISLESLRCLLFAKDTRLIGSGAIQEVANARNK